MRDIILTRVELYERLWQKPMRIVARDLGFSDVGLAKRCRKARIPYPGHGYWARVAAGQAPRRPPLPDADHNPSFAFGGPRPTPAAPPAPSNEPHPLLPTEFALRASISEVLTTIPSPPRNLRIDDRLPFYKTESRDSRRRARTLLTHIVVLAKALGWTFVQSTRDAERHLQVEGERIGLRLKERRRRELPPWTAAELRLKARGDYVSRHETWHPTGELWIDLTALQFSYHSKSYRDAATIPLEKRLSALLNGLLDVAIEAKVARQEHEERERQRREQEHLKYLRHQRAAREGKLISELEKQFGAWLRAKWLRRYVRAVRRTLTDATSWMVKVGDDELDFLAWADGYIAQLDPLDPAPRNPDLHYASYIYRPEELDKNAIARLLGLRGQESLKMAGTDSADDALSGD